MSINVFSRYAGKWSNHFMEYSFSLKRSNYWQNLIFLVELIEIYEYKIKIHDIYPWFHWLFLSCIKFYSWLQRIKELQWKHISWTARVWASTGRRSITCGQILTLLVFTPCTLNASRRWPVMNTFQKWKFISIWSQQLKPMGGLLKEPGKTQILTEQGSKH